jgi:hypothetical protein
MWLLLPTITVLEDVCDFIGSVISTRTESVPADIPNFYAKVCSPSVGGDVFLNPYSSVAFEE